MQCHRAAIRTLALTALALPFAVGCGGSKAPTTAGADSASSVSEPNSTAPAATIVAEGEETAAAQSVAIFLDSLRKGDERAANGVLTAKAREELAKTAYVIQPLGTPEGQYNIGRVGFPYAEQDIALVECTWTEPPMGEEPPATMDIVCEVHKDTEGWRISGIGVSIPGTDQALVLDFENAEALQATIDAATGQGPQPTQQATGTQAVNSQQPEYSLPAFPTDAATAPSNTSPTQQQIALPPLNNAPLNR